MSETTASEGLGPPNEALMQEMKVFVAHNLTLVHEARYQLERIIGRGASGVVVAGKDLQSNRAVAVKSFTVSGLFDTHHCLARLLTEIKMLRLLRGHENIALLLRVMPPAIRGFDQLNAVLDQMPTTLAHIIRSAQPLTNDHVCYFVYQLLRGLKYIHSAGVIHCDLKPHNLLVNAECDLRIADFSQARVRPASLDDSYVQARWYTSPELLFNIGQFSKAADIWAVGCIAAELIRRSPLFPAESFITQIVLLNSALGTDSLLDAPDSTVPSQAKECISKLPRHPKRGLSAQLPSADPLAVDLIEKLLLLDPEGRLTAAEALLHPYFADLHDGSNEPVCDPIDPTEFNFEELPTSQEELRTLIFEEARDHYLDYC